MQEDEAFFCTELTPWRPGLTRRGTPVVHVEALSSKRPEADWIDKKCPICLAEWADKEREP